MQRISGLSWLVSLTDFMWGYFCDSLFSDLDGVGFVIAGGVFMGLAGNGRHVLSRREGTCRPFVDGVGRAQWVARLLVRGHFRRIQIPLWFPDPRRSAG